MPKKKGYGQFCPVAKAAEIVAERWTLLVLRELILGSHRFNELRRGVPLMSPSLLSQRLRELEDGGVVVRHSTPQTGNTTEYHLTRAGMDLGPIIMSLGQWGARWAKGKLQPEDYDPALLMWDMRRRIDMTLLPKKERIVAAFDLDGSPRQMRRWWLVLENGDVDVCLKDPGYAVNIDVSGDIRSLVEVWMGRMSMDQAVRAGRIRFEGPKPLAAAFRRSLKLSTLAQA
jgi:DNA-binding HxlR family transcriptional regulator